MDSGTDAHVNAQLIATIDGITSKLRTGKDQVDINLLDFAKTFGKVYHVRLPYKLNYYGIRAGTFTPGSKNSRVNSLSKKVKNPSRTKYSLASPRGLYWVHCCFLSLSMTSQM